MLRWLAGVLTMLVQTGAPAQLHGVPLMRAMAQRLPGWLPLHWIQISNFNEIPHFSPPFFAAVVHTTETLINAVHLVRAMAKLLPDWLPLLLQLNSKHE